MNALRDSCATGRKTSEVKIHAPLLEAARCITTSCAEAGPKKLRPSGDAINNHPSLDFKRLKGGSRNRFSIRIGDHDRAIGQSIGDTVDWVWIGSHEDYKKLI